ncbi:hypothetical protein KC19_11G174000, partial [Ceratodon purpureus]
MVKFSKQLEGSLVPEWKGAYCNYKVLKRDVNRIKQDRLRLQSSAPRSSFEGHLRSLGSISGLHSLGSHLKRTATGLNPLSRGVHDEGDEETAALYDAELIEPLGHAEQDKVFFNHLDAELEKINRFYKTKEAEFVAQGIRLEKQLLALFEVQEALARQNLKMQTFSFAKSPEHYRDDLLDTEPGHESPLLEVVTVRRGDEFNSRRKSSTSEKKSVGSEEASASNSSDEEMEIIANFIENVDLTEAPDQESTDEYSVSDGVTAPPLGSMTSGTKSSSQLRKPVGGTSSDESSVVLSETDAASPLPVVEKKADFHSRLQQTRETGELQSNRKSKRPKRLIQDMIDMSLGKKKVQSSEKMLRTAFVEFYRGLGLLKSYCSLNMVAFAKIMKKYDKVVRHKFGPVYIREVERSYFASSDKVTKLMTKVEEIFTKYFADHDRRKAMRQLRPMQQHGGHNITFLLGIFSGASMALLVGFLLLVSSTAEYRKVGGRNYMDTVFRVFSTLGLVLLHMYMYGWNVYAWQRVRINYPFIFEFSPGTELRYREIFLVCTAFTSLLLGTMIAHIIASTRQAPTGSYTAEFAPLGITLVFLVALFTPVNILYRSSRIFFLRCMQRVIFAPFYKVILADFFLGDQLTSQVASFRNFEFILCYYSGGYFHDREEDSCTKNITFQVLMYVFSLLPYSFRFWQCLRRWRDEGDKRQLYNAGKYASAMLAMVVKLTYMIKQDTIWLVLFILFSCFATLYQIYWDLVIDWGLLQTDSKNRYLRDNLILRKKYIYFVSMGVNVVLRLAWVSSIQHLNSFPGFSQAGWDTIFASLEVIRRGHWNFYRLENEHLNNVGKFRAVKTVPLPFKEFETSWIGHLLTFCLNRLMQWRKLGQYHEPCLMLASHHQCINPLMQATVE